MIEGALRRLDQLWFLPASAWRLAVLRLVIGGYTLNLLVRNFNFYLRNAATSPSLFEPVGPVAILDAPLPINVFQALLCLTVLLGILFVLGLGHRLTGPLFGLLLLWTLSYRNSWTMIFHTDNLLVLHVLILGFTRSADALSLDSLWRSRSAAGVAGTLQSWIFHPPQPSWRYGYSVRLLCLVTCLTYFLSGVAKLSGPLGASWAVGEALRSQVAMDVWRKEMFVAAPPQMIYGLYDHLWLFALLGFGTLLLEVGAPLVMLWGWLALVWIPATFLMHWGILAIMGIEFPYQLRGVAFAPFISMELALAAVRSSARLVPFNQIHRPRLKWQVQDGRSAPT